MTAIAGEPQRNIDFYAGVLGLRLVKLTVNFDDPTTYHLYYGDGQGHPGTILTFFPWPGAMQGRVGTGQFFRRARSRFPGSGRSTARTRQLAGCNPDRACEHGPVPVDFAIRGFHHVTLSEEGYERTARPPTETLGFRLVDSKGNRFRYAVSPGGSGTIVDVLCIPAGRAGRVSVGTVHHVAWRTPTDEQQVLWRSVLGPYNVTPVIDRKYFHSIYFREPGGVLFEIATDPPGFAIDEPASELGTHLLLPPWLEPSRAELEAILPKVHLPVASMG